MARVAYDAADKMDRFPVADVESSVGVDPSTAGVGFGVEASLARGVAIAEGREDDEGMPGDGDGVDSLLLDPLSLLFDGDEEDEPADAGNARGSALDSALGSALGGGGRRGFSDEEVRRRLGLLDDDDDAVRSELASLIEDIGAEAVGGGVGVAAGGTKTKPASKGFGRSVDEALDRALWGTFGRSEEEKAEAMRAFQGKYGGADDADAEAAADEEGEEGEEEAYPIEEEDGGYTLIGDGDEG